MENVEVIQKPEIKFIFIPHSKETIKQIIEKIGNANIILVESTGGTKEEREFQEYLINYAAQKPDINDKKWIMDNMIAKENEVNGNNAFLFGLYKFVIDTEKELHFLDVEEAGPGLDEIEKAQLSHNKVFELAQAGKFDEALKIFQNYIIFTASSIHQRNNVVKNQITDKLESNNKEWQDKKIVVIQGEDHRETYRNFKQENVRADSSHEFLSKKLHLA